MMEIVRPRPELRETIMGLGETDINLCYTCSSCVCECPVNMKSGTAWDVIAAVKSVL